MIVVGLETSLFKEKLRMLQNEEMVYASYHFGLLSCRPPIISTFLIFLSVQDCPFDARGCFSPHPG